MKGGFTIENIGDPDTSINWYIAEWPDWGVWNFLPYSGDDLKPEDDPIKVNVNVRAPDQKNTVLFGDIKIVNEKDCNDFAMVPVFLTTVKYMTNNPILIRFLERIIDHFQFFLRFLRV
jgi:hypothetical protein